MAYVVVADVRTGMTTDDGRDATEREFFVYPQHGCDGALSTEQRIHVHITVLGGFAVTVDGATTPALDWSRRSASALVKILALAPGHRVHREQVLDLLWPDEPPDRSAPRLHKAAYFARRAAGCSDAVVLRGDVVSLFPDADLTVDALEFERLARLAAQHGDAGVARDALAWYAGELLPADRYEDWAADRRELLALRRLDLLRIAGDWRDLAEVDPTHEEAHLRLMERQIDEGDVVAAVRQYDHLARVLERELGVEPNAAVRQARHHAGALLGLDLSSGNSRVARVLAELTGLVHRQGAILAELSSRCGCPSETFRNAVGA